MKPAPPSRDYCKVFEKRYVHPKKGRALVVGSRIFSHREDRRLLYSKAIGIDMSEGPGVDIVADLEARDDFGPFAHIDCLSVLEHSRRPWVLAHNIETMLIPGGTIYVTVPFVWRVHGYPQDFWRFTCDGVAQLFPRIKWERMSYATGIGLQRKVPAENINDKRYLARAEVCAFGVRRGDLDHRDR